MRAVILLKNTSGTAGQEMVQNLMYEFNCRNKVIKCYHFRMYTQPNQTSLYRDYSASYNPSNVSLWYNAPHQPFTLLCSYQIFYC